MSWARHKPGTQWSGTSLDLTGVYIKSCGRDIHVILSLQHVGWNFNWFEFACHEAGTGCEDKCPPPSFLADIVLCCFVEKSIVRTKFISATCCIKFSWFEFVCHEAGTWCRSKPSDLAWFYEKIPCFGGQDFYSATCCSMKFSWFEFVHHEAGTWWPYHWHCPCHISSGIYVLAFITLL